MTAAHVPDVSDALGLLPPAVQAALPTCRALAGLRARLAPCGIRVLRAVRGRATTGPTWVVVVACADGTSREVRAPCGEGPLDDPATLDAVAAACLTP